MLGTASAHAMIAASDIGRAKDFYSGTLGLQGYEDPGGTAIRYGAADGSWFMVYRSPHAGTARNTCMRFEVQDVEAAVARLRDRGVARLRDRGVVFEEYDLPGLTTVEGIARHESGARGAWFKDPDGNVLEVAQGTEEALGAQS